MNIKVLLSFSFLFLALGEEASAQSMRALSNGFSLGRSSGISSNFRQISNAEANSIIDIFTQNITGDSKGYSRAIPDQNYTIDNKLDPFSVVINRNSNSAGSSETIINNSAFSGFSLNIFTQ